jgi:serine/threonine protein kinase
LTSLFKGSSFINSAFALARSSKDAAGFIITSAHKLADFGLSRTIKKKHDIYKMSGCTGTLRYMAPEILFNKGEDYNLMIDIYSLALNYWFIATGTRPFNEIDKNPHIIHLIKEGFRPNINDIHNNAELKKLIIRMWDTCPEMRPDIKEVLDEFNLITEKIEKDDIKSHITSRKCTVM